MIFHYIKTALRNINRNRFYSAINLIGLALGLACCILIGYYINDELSYDQFFENKDRIFRIKHTTIENGTARESVSAPVPLGPTLKAEFPDFETVVRFWRSVPVLHVESENLVGDNFYYADSDVFSVFSVELKEGNPESVLSQPNSLVISESVAYQLFGEDNPIGNIISYEGYPAGKRDLMVSGVMKDLPENTHLEIDYLASMVGMDREEEELKRSLKQRLKGAKPRSGRRW